MVIFRSYMMLYVVMYVYQRVVNHTINDKLTINYSNYIIIYNYIYILSYNYSILLVNGFVHLKLEAISPIPTKKAKNDEAIR